MGDSSDKMVATVGQTRIDITKTVRDIRGREELVKDAIETTWNENLVNQMKVWLQPYPHANDMADWDRVLLERYAPPLY